MTQRSYALELVSATLIEVLFSLVEALLIFKTTRFLGGSSSNSALGLLHRSQGPNRNFQPHQTRLPLYLLTRSSSGKGREKM
jgi:hypothetical protein